MEREASEQPAAHAPGVLADRLNHLFATIRPARGEYSAAEVARWILQHGGRISAVYILKLRSGEKANPSEAYLEWLARFFNVPTSTLSAGEPWDLDPELLQAQIAVRDDVDVRSALLRFLRLSPGSQAALSSVIDNLLAAERAAPAREPGQR